jgi:hypothetical protein
LGAAIAGLDDPAAAGVVVGRVTGTHGLRWGCVAGRGGTALEGMVTCISLVTLFLACLGRGGVWVGFLLWLIVALHAVLSTSLVRMGLRDRPKGN